MSKRIVLVALAGLLVWGCQELRPNRSYVQELALRKDAFQGTWYYSTTAVDSSYEASWVFPGKQDLFLHKIQWKVEKDFLYAYRTHAVTRGADRGLAYRTREEVGEPVAAFAISKHFDIRHSYSPTTGEEYNVIEENETDRLWYDREYMRVDWSANQINNFSYTRGDLFRALGFLEPEIQPVDFFVEDINSPFAPKFRDDDGDGIFDYIDIVHQVTLNPTGYEVHVIEQLTPAQMTIRSSFLRTPEERDFEPLFFPDTKFERFGYFRNERGTYQDNYGETDFLDYFANRYNIWEQVHTDEECYAHDVCGAGSHCDLYHHKCTLPYEQRTEKPIVYTMTANFPDLYLDQVPLIANGWNQAFQATVNGLKYGGTHKLACLTDDSKEAEDGDCCTTAQRAVEAVIRAEAAKRVEEAAEGSEEAQRAEEALRKVEQEADCVPDMYVIRQNTCTIDNVREYLGSHGFFRDAVAPYTDAGEINLDNLVRVCAALEAASHRSDTEEKFTWEQLGDLRHSFLSYVDSPSGGSPLGYGPLNADTETGETINGNANIYGAALETYRGFIQDWYDLVDGTVDPDRFANGEHVREYFQNMGQATGQPTVPEVFLPNPVDLDPDALQVSLADLHARFDDKIEVLEKQREFGSEVKRLAGTYLEDMILNEEYLLANGISPQTPLTEELKDRISPFRNTVPELREKATAVDRALERESIFTVEAAEDVTVEHLIWEARRRHEIAECQGAYPEAFDADEDGLDADEREALKDAVDDYRSRPECREWALDWIMKQVFRGVTEHEIGHTIGLRHNFEASYDEEGYHEPYWRLKEQLPDVELADFDTQAEGEEGHAEIDLDEYREYLAAREDLKRTRELAGIDQYMYSSIMDYGGQFYSDLAGVGRWDKAAIKFGYGELREVYDGEPDATRSNRIDVPTYDGGEICIRHADCPAHDGTKYANYREGRPGDVATMTQTCGVRGTRSDGKEEWRPIEESGGKGFCSSWDEDVLRAAFPIPRHNFCSDERADDRAHCSRFDEGPSSVEIVENIIETYERRYVFNNFRRYRRWFPSRYYSYLDRYYSVIGKQFQSMIWRIWYQEGFSTDAGPGGFRDMFSASVMGMNFFSNVLTRPGIGPYRWDDESELLVRCGRSDDVGSCWDDSASQYDITLANGGKYMWSVYEQGYYGAIQRLSQMGTFADKDYALWSLATRSWSTAGGHDESIPFNYYDVFGDSMLDLFSGVITDNYERFAPIAVFDDEGFVDHIEFRDFWYGTFQGSDVESSRLRGYEDENSTPEERYAQARLIDPGLSVIHKMFALIYSLTGFSSWFDATFADYVQLIQYDATWEPDPDYDAPNPLEEYRSPLRGKIFRAVQTDDEMSIAVDLVLQAKEARERFERAATEDERRAARRQLENAESFLNIASDIIRQLGISYGLRFR